MIRLGGVIGALTAQRAFLAANVRARVAAARAAAVRVPAGAPAAPAAAPGSAARAAPPAAPVPARSPGAEASTLTVQNVLFILGGALLAVAAIVFTAVAWATFGVGGRAAILAGVTAAALAAPPLALRRRLVATAETFAALGLLLIVLDGYAARYVNLFGAAAMPATRYAGVVAAVTAVAAAGYGAATGLRGPGIAALLAAQPVLPLLVADAGLGPAGWSVVFTAVAAANLVAGRVPTWLAGLRRPRPTPEPRLPPTTTSRHDLARYLIRAGLPAGALLALSWLCAAVALTTADSPAAGLRAGLALVAFAATLWTVPRVAGRADLNPPVDAVLVLATAIAAARVAGLAAPDHRLILLAGLTLAVAAAVRRRGVGARIAGWLTTAVVALGVGGLTGFAAAVSAFRALPAWHADLTAADAPFAWQLPGAVALVALAAAVLLPAKAWHLPAIVGGAALAMSLPGGLSLPWWSPPAVDALAVLALAATTTALAPRAPGAVWHPRVVAGVAALGLAGHAALAGLARPGSTAAVAGALALIGLAVAARLPALPVFAGPALAVALLAWPAAAAATAQTAGGHPARVALAAAGVLPAAVLAVRRWWPALTGYAVAALAVAALAVSWPPAPESAAVYAGTGVLIVALAGRSVPTLVCAALLTVRVLVGAATAWLATLAEPYAQLDRAWSGVPVPPHVPAPAAVALALAAGGWVAVGRAWAGRWRGALPAVVAGAPVVALAGLAAAGAPWPTLPATTLLFGVASLLAAALLRRPAVRWTALGAGLPLAGAGLAGAAATEGTTLAALAVVAVAATAVGASAGTGAVRVTGWLAAVAAAVSFAGAAAAAANLPGPAAGRWILLAAAAALATSAVVRERAALSAAAHAAAVVAVIVTGGGAAETALLFALWGAVIGLRAAHPGDVRLAVAAAACEVVAWWLLLASNRVDVVEAYTVPAAVAVLFAGWLALRRRPELRSWVAYGPGLAAGLLPSLAVALAADAAPVRRLLVGAAAVAVVVAGAVRRRQAPVVIGGGVALVVALHELAVVWQLLATWIPLSLAGLLLVGLAMTYERRRRELRRLRAAVTRMT